MYKFLLAFTAAMYFAMLWPLARSATARRRWFLLWRLWSYRQIPFAFLTVLAVFGVGLGLYLAHPVFAFSWLGLIGGGGTLSTGGVAAASPDADLSLFIISVFIFSAFLILIPHLAHIEERWFRRGSESRGSGKRFAWALAFGLTHMAVGVPLGFALSSTFLGLSATHRYRQAFARRQSRADAVRSATSLHLTYNTLIAANFFAVLALVLSKRYLSAG